MKNGKFWFLLLNPIQNVSICNHALCVAQVFCGTKEV